MGGSSNDDRDDQQKLPLKDVDDAAKAERTTRAKVQQDVSTGAQSPQDVTDASQQQNSGQGTSNQDNFSQPDYNSQAQPDPDQRQGGYRETQGAGYGQSQNTIGQPADVTQAQEGYDPTHSGVRHAQNQPGKRPPTPGRETGTSWGKDQQMGVTTDTPDRKNPAG